MNIYDNIFNNIETTNTGVIAIGYFDAIHKGHIKILNELLKISNKKKIEHYVLTYNNLPLKEKKHKKILEINDKINLLKELGIKNLIMCDFDKYFYSLTPEKFIYIINKNFNIEEFVIGKDFKFGKNKSGNILTLKKLNYITNLIDPLYIDDIKISTSKIKEYITEGMIEKANNFMPRNFYIKGIVQEGKKLGRHLGFPTMNIMNNEIIFPKNGVYATKTYINNIEYCSMTYISSPIIETHLLNYNKYEYNIKIKVDFFKKIRDNQHFKNNNLLIEQLNKDLKYIKDFFGI